MTTKSLENGYDVLEVEISKTIQEADFEPLKYRAVLKRMVKPDEISSQFRELSEILENEICDALDLEKPSKDVPF